MSQSFNSDAFKSTLKILFHDHTPAIPHFAIADIREISPRKLKEQGVQGVIFDKDNTITAPYKNEIYEPLRDVVQEFQDTFGENMMILSNSAGTKDDTDYADAMEIEAKLNIPVIRHDRKKPEGIESVEQVFSCPLESIVMIGDRLLTDTLFGNHAGMLTIHTGILTAKGDNKPAALARIWENSLLRRWKKQGGVAPIHPLQSIILK